MSEELKDCPFCGGEARHDAAAVPTDKPEYGSAWIVCIECGASGPYFDFFDDIENTISHWNTRHIPEGFVLVPVACMVEHLELLQKSDYRELYKLIVGDQIKAMIKAAGNK